MSQSIICDWDGTLRNGIHTIDFLRYSEMSLDMNKELFSEKAEFLYYTSYKHGEISYERVVDEIFDVFLSFYKRFGEDKARELSLSFADEDPHSELLISLQEKCKSGARVAIISGSPALLIEPYFRSFGAEIIAGDIKSEQTFGSYSQKVAAVKHLLNKWELSKVDWALGNAPADHALFDVSEQYGLVSGKHVEHRSMSETNHVKTEYFAKYVFASS